MWITNGGFADVYIVFAKVGGEKFTAFIVERTFPGFKPGNEEHKMGIHGSSTTPIFLENCKVPKENLLHEIRSEEHTSELQSQSNLVCRLLLEKKKKKETYISILN